MILFIFALTLLYIYLGGRIAYEWFDWIAIACLFVALLSFPFKKIFRYQLHFIYAAMGILTYLTLYTVLRDLIWLTTGQLVSISFVLLFTFATNVYGLINAVKGPKIKSIMLPKTGLPDDLAGFKIAQISDLHIGATINKPYVEKVVSMVNGLKPDIIVLTGDIGDGKTEHYREDIEPLRFLKSRYGSFFVPGNHEYYWNANEWLTVMNNIGVINLVNRGKIIRHKSHAILIGGVPDKLSGLYPDLAGIQASHESENTAFKILLSHRPGIALEANRHGYNLQLSGHTHAGQFFPWTIVVKFVHKHVKGLHKIGDMWLYVNTGTGSWGPLIRLGSSPEITLLTLTQETTYIKNETI